MQSWIDLLDTIAKGWFICINIGIGAYVYVRIMTNFFEDRK